MAALLAVVLLVGLIDMAAMLRRTDTVPVYTVAELQAALNQATTHATLRMWAGRTFQLRGVITSYVYGSLTCNPTCDWPGTSYEMRTPPDPISGQAGFELHAAPSHSWLDWVRTLPIVGSLLPSRHAVQVGREATYLVRLEDKPNPGGCGPIWCFNLVLLDVASPSTYAFSLANGPGGLMVVPIAPTVAPPAAMPRP